MCGSTDIVMGIGSAINASSVSRHWPQSSMMIARRALPLARLTGRDGSGTAVATDGTALGNVAASGVFTGDGVGSGDSAGSGVGVSSPAAADASALGSSAGVASSVG